MIIFSIKVLLEVVNWYKEGNLFESFYHGYNKNKKLENENFICF